MITRTVRLTSLQAITIYNILFAETGLSRADKFQVAGVLRRIRALGDYDPQIHAFRLLSPTEYDLKAADGSPVLLPDGEPKKGYKYAPEVLKNSFPDLVISCAESDALARCLASLLAPCAQSAGHAIEVLDIAEWLDVLGDVSALVTPKDAP